MTENTPETEPRTGTSRRTLVAAAAWSVPVIVVASASPAHATSANSTLTVDVVKTSITAGGASGANASNVVVTVLDSQGRPWAGQPVTLTFSPARVSLGASTGTTNAAGQFTTTLTAGANAMGGIRTITATSDVLTATDTVTVIGSDVIATGYNGYGQLGDASTANKSTPVFTARVFPSPVAMTANGRAYTLYLLDDGTVWSSGYGGSGQLGTGTTTDASTPTQIAGLAGVTQIAAGDDTGYALLSNGQVRAWGSNEFGQVGDGTTTNRTSPVVVRVAAGGAALSGISQIAGAGEAALALTTGGQVRAWGNNQWAQLANGTTTGTSSVPVTVRAVGGAAGSSLSGVAQISAGSVVCYAVLSNGQAVAWGNRSNGALANGTSGTNTRATSPEYVRNAADTANLSGIAQIAGGFVSVAILLTNGQVRTAGGEVTGELGNADGAPGPLPIVVQAVGGGGQLTNVAEIAGGSQLYYARRTDGSVVSWGGGAAGQVGNGTTPTTQATPVVMTLPSGRTARRLASSLGMARSQVNSGFGTVILAP